MTQAGNAASVAGTGGAHPSRFLPLSCAWVTDPSSLRCVANRSCEVRGTPSRRTVGTMAVKIWLARGIRVSVGRRRPADPATAEVGLETTTGARKRCSAPWPDCRPRRRMCLAWWQVYQGACHRGNVFTTRAGPNHVTSGHRGARPRGAVFPRKTPAGMATPLHGAELPWWRGSRLRCLSGCEHCSTGTSPAVATAPARQTLVKRRSDGGAERQRR